MRQATLAFVSYGVKLDLQISLLFGLQSQPLAIWSAEKTKFVAGLLTERVPNLSRNVSEVCKLEGTAGSSLP
jgi:hypothetical protein